jgi:hypothetical protein
MQNLATQQQMHVSIVVFSPSVCPHPAHLSRPRCTRHERCSLRCVITKSSWPTLKARCSRCSFAKGSPPSKAAWSHFAGSSTRSFRHTDYDVFYLVLQKQKSVCRRVTMLSRRLVSCSRALVNCPDVKGESDTYVDQCVTLHVCKLQQYCQGMLCFEVDDCFDVLDQVHVQRLLYTWCSTGR